MWAVVGAAIGIICGYAINEIVHAARTEKPAPCTIERTELLRRRADELEAEAHRLRLNGCGAIPREMEARAEKLRKMIAQ